MGFEIDPTYKEVPERIADFKAKHPDGSLQPLNPDKPWEIVTVDNKTFIVYVAAAYRTPDDPRPGVGSAYEPFPGKTPYTKDSELQNAETSAWGRAIVAALASESKTIASAQDVRNRQADRDAPPPPTITGEQAEALRARLNTLTGTQRGEFKAKFGLPDQVAADKLEAAEALVAGYEVAAADPPDRKGDATGSSSDGAGGTEQSPGSPSTIDAKAQQRLHIAAGDVAKQLGHLNRNGNGDSKWADAVLEACVYAVTNHADTSTKALTVAGAKQVRVYLDAFMDGTATAEVSDGAVVLDTPMGKHRFRRTDEGGLALLQGVAS